MEEPTNDEWPLLLNHHHLRFPPSPWSLMALWGLISLSLHCWVCLRSTVTAAAAAASNLPSDKPGGPLDWLLSDKGPFHHSSEYVDFVEKNRQGFSTRYKIYRSVTAICYGKSPTRLRLIISGYPFRDGCVHMDKAAVSTLDNKQICQQKPR